jgi:hypothetical protein
MKHDRSIRKMYSKIWEKNDFIEQFYIQRIQKGKHDGEIKKQYF